MVNLSNDLSRRAPNGRADPQQAFVGRCSCNLNIMGMPEVGRLGPTNGPIDQRFNYAYLVPVGLNCFLVYKKDKKDVKPKC